MSVGHGAGMALLALGMGQRGIYIELKKKEAGRRGGTYCKTALKPFPPCAGLWGTSQGSGRRTCCQHRGGTPQQTPIQRPQPRCVMQTDPLCLPFLFFFFLLSPFFSSQNLCLAFPASSPTVPAALFHPFPWLPIPLQVSGWDRGHLPSPVAPLSLAMQMAVPCPDLGTLAVAVTMAPAPADVTLRGLTPPGGSGDKLGAEPPGTKQGAQPQVNPSPPQEPLFRV